MPARERLGADHAAGRELHDRLVGDLEAALLDRALSERGMSGDAIPGYEQTRAPGHLEVAAAVASGAADAGVGIRAAGTLYGLHALTLPTN